MNPSIRSSVRSSRLANNRSRRFVSRHLTLLSVLLVLGVAVSGLTWGRLGGASSAERETHRVRTGGESPVPAPVKASNVASMPSTVTTMAPTTVTVNAGPDTDAANNDYRRIQNELNAAVTGDTIILSGTFDFTQPYAAAAWALGNDNTAGTADDYEVIAPGVSNVTLTANSLGAATIQGPGDLAAVNLEAFLVFDASLSGATPGWTISNLRILDFDLSIGMFANGVSDYDNTTIQNNFIRIPTDLNATVAPVDVNQNIGINFSFGKNQSILGNTFNIPGDGVSNGANTSASVVIQSNSSGGSVYDGLTISNNVIHVLNAQSANPEVILGIWDECHADTSNITISNNSFINDAAGNSSALNQQRAFRVTSHSGASSLVKYDSNTVNGANIGFQWKTGSDFTGNQAVVLTGNQITNSDTGVLIQSNGIAHFENNVITGSGSGGGIHLITGMLTGSPAAFPANLNSIYRSFVSGGSGDGILIDATAGSVSQLSQNDLSGNTGFGLDNLSAPAIVAESNWWGNNLAANVAAKVSGPATFDPWLASGTDISASTGFQPFIYATTTTAANLTTLAGTAAADTGSMLNTSPVTLTMDGDTGFVPVAQLLNVSIQLGNSDDVFTLGQTGIPTVLDGGADNDTLVGTNVAQTWNITGANSGSIPGATSSFSNVESLRGGTTADSFVFGAAGSLGQTIDGNLGADTLDNSAIPAHTITPTGAGTLDGSKGTATGVDVGFDNINAFFPSPSSVSGTKTVSGTFAPSGSITYTVVLLNSSTFAQLDNLGNEFTDVLPAGLTLVSASATSGTAVANVGTNTATWSGSIAGGGSVTVTITATINSNAGGTTISNQGTISYDANGDGTNETNASTDDPNVIGASDPTSFFVCSNSIVVTTTNNSGAGSLRQAILDACPGATITFSVTGTISLSNELVIDKNLTIQGPATPGLMISGSNTNRVFNIQSGMTLLISDLTIANGKASTGGGGIRNDGTLTITGSTITNNTTPDGADATGAVNGGNSGDGGGIYNTGTLTLINSTLSGNQTGRGGDNLSGGTGNGGNSGNGAGIYSTGTVLLTNTTITNNSVGRVGRVANTDPPPPGVQGNAGLVGGVFNSGGTITLNNTIVANNHNGFGDEDDLNGVVDSSSASNLIGSDAGLSGISNGSNGNQIGTAAIPLSPHLGALADNGGPTKTHLPDQFSTAIDAGSNALAIDQGSNPLTTDQRGTGFPRRTDGGAGKPDEPTVDIGAVEGTLTPPPPGADLTVAKSVDRDTVVPDRDLTYTIIVTNHGADPATGVSLTDTLPLYTTNSDPDNPTTASTTFVSLTPAGGWSCSSPAVGFGGSVSCTKASFAGASNQTFTLVVHVPPSAVPNEIAPFISNSVSVDDTNDTNTENNSGSAVTQLFSCFTDPIVTKNADSGPGSLRQAIADACVGSTITFDMTPGHVVSPITLTSGELAIGKNLTIQGPGANLLTISGNNSSRVFNVTVASPGIVKISGLTIANGKVTSAFGGGILNSSTATVNVTTSVLNNNSATSGGGGIGNSSTGTVNVSNSTLSGNSAGGGIFNNSGTFTLTNSTVSGNSGSAFGGGINNQAGTLTLTNSTITNNRSDSDNSGGELGGGISSISGTVTLKNTIVAGNFRGTGTTRDDINGAIDATSSFNLIADGTNMTGIGNGSGGNQVGSSGSPINAVLGALASNGGATQTHLLLPGSPAINAGSNANLPADTFDLDGDSDTAEPLPVDQRAVGFARVVNSTVDIGAVEVNYAISATAGTPQSATINSAFATALKATVTESGNPQNAVSVTFTAPGSGASGAFPGPSATAVVATNSSGVATAPTFTANGTAGGYNVVASLGTGLPTANFALTNNKINQTITFGALANKNFGDPDFGVSASATSGLVVSFTASGSCTVTGSTVHITSAGSCTITAKQAGDSSFNAATDVPQSFNIANRALVSLSQSTYLVNESAGFVTITVNRIGDLSVPVTVDYATSDNSGPSSGPCVNGTGQASSRCDYTSMFGTLKFAATETQKTFIVPVTLDSFTEGPEMFTVTLSNLTGTGAAFATPSNATVTISDATTTLPGNAIDDTDAFVRTQYHDFLNREADAAGLAFWKNNIDQCKAPGGAAGFASVAQCIEVMRINTSAAFFLSIEFKQTGGMVRDFYVAALDRPATNNMPNFVEFERDTQAVQRGVIVDPNNNAWQTVLNANRLAFMNDFVMRAEFVGLYPTTDTPNTYVGKLYQHALGRTPTAAELANATSGFGSATTAADPTARGQALLKVTQATDFQTREINRSFVHMQYLGYLRRNPNDAPDTDFSGYNFWLTKLNQFNGNFIQAEMVKAFLSSAEYRHRFGP
jgi:uncharacterized repeat protein (TIGR01451 family)